MAGKFSSAGAAKTKKRITVGSVIFYTLFLLFIGACVFGLIWGKGALTDWLVTFQASQPDVKSQQVFEELFGDPDWAAIYKLAGEEDTTYEGSDAFAAYMEALVGDEKLTYVETSAGLTGNKKYLVKLGDKMIADFSLTDNAPDEEIPDWMLHEVNVFYKRNEDALIFTLPGHTVHINGVALDDSFIVKTTSTVAEEYLPEGIHGYRDQTLYIEGLLMQPEVTITDENGQNMEVVFDQALGIYREVIPTAQETPAEVTEMITNAAQAYGKYMINASGHGLKTYFDTNGQAYKDIILFERWTMQDYRSYEFTDVVVSGYYPYSDTLYSARVSMALNVTYRSLFTSEIMVKTYNIDTTFFVKKNDRGKWLVDTMTNVDVQQMKTNVKIVCISAGEMLMDVMVDASAATITLPPVEVPEGKEFLGWFTKDTDVNGKTTYSLVFSPSEDGMVTLPSDMDLEPMTLYAQFR